MKFDKKRVEAAASELLKELDSDNDIIVAVINEKVKDRHIVASLNINNDSYEFWKRKNGQFDVVKSSFPKEADFRKVLSKKQIGKDILVDIINKLIDLFGDDENSRKEILDKLNENKQDTSE